MIKSENACPTPLSSDAEALAHSTVDIEPVAECPSPELPVDEPKVTRIIPGTGSPAPTPSEYEVLTESCDWCIVDTPWSGEDFETPSSSYEGAENTTDKASQRLKKTRNSVGDADRTAKSSHQSSCLFG